MKGKKTLYVIGLVALAALLMAVGLSRVVWVYRHYRTDMLTNESRHLNSIVSASARSMDWMMNGYAMQIEQLPGRREFQRAEEEYAEKGDPVVLRALMARPDVRASDMSYAIAVYDVDGTFLAETEQGFPVDAGGDEAVGSRALLRTDGEGGFWFVFRKRADSGLVYELAVPVQTVFSYHADAARVGRHGFLFLMDGDGRFFSYSGNGVSETHSVAELLSENPAVDPAALAELSQRSMTPPEDYAVYRYPWNEVADLGRSGSETLVVTCPLNTSGGMLLVGAAVSFQESNSLLSDTLQEVTWIILMEIGGALILFLVAAWILVVNRRNRLELQAVRERADLMEEINRQQQSLAHTERLQQLGVMTSGIVHEFNNMLTPIMSQSMLLLEQLADQEASLQFESALDIYEASENARDVLRRMSSMGKKDVDMGFRTVDLGALLKKTMNLASMAKDTHILQEIVLPGEPIFVSGNEQLLTQAFLNLCINACQAMGAEGTLTVTAAEELRSGRVYARVEVSDTGPGIEEEKFGSIYDPYFTTKGERGTGLGLAICKKIIETHKGTISAANREAGGAVFTVRIPVTELPGEDDE